MQSSFLLHVVLATLMVIFSNEQDVIAGHSGLSPAPAEEGRIRVMAVWEDADSLGVPKFTGRTRRDTTEGKVRRKRSWIFPGTLWCGTGSKAMAYEQLGMFESTDRCCREHDHCKHMIPAFTVNYGVFNPNFFTVSHCDCDQRFRQCLFHVNDTISSMVGYSFFNILRVPCIEFIQQTRCIHMYWWGTCKVVKEALQAIFKKPLPYNSSDIISNSWEGEYNMSTIIEGQHGRERPLISPNRKSPNRKSPKGERKCGPSNPPRGDTFHSNKTKGKGCKKSRKPSIISSTPMPSVLMTHTSIPILTTASPIQKITSVTSELKTALSNDSKSSISVSNKKRLGKNKGTRKGLLGNSTHKNQVLSEATTNSNPKTTSTTQNTSQTPAVHLPTTMTTVNKTTKSHKGSQKQSRRCSSRMNVRGNTFQQGRKSCLQQNATSNIAPSTSTTTLMINVTTAQPQRINKTTESPKRQTTKTLRNTATTAMTIKTTNKTGLLMQTADSLHQDGKPQKQKDSFAEWDNSSQEITENQLLCRSLRYLDECKYKIPPLEKKYDRHNMESKTAYHCDCTSRLAAQIESFRRPSILPSLLKDFVSQNCFSLPTEKKCHYRKSCSGGFTKASDLLQALKKIEEKDAGVQNSGNDRKRGIPVRLYKRCLRIVDSWRRG